MYCIASLAREHELAIVAAVFLGVVHADSVETLLDRARAFVGGQDSVAWVDHGPGDFVQCVANSRFRP